MQIQHLSKVIALYLNEDTDKYLELAQYTDVLGEHDSNKFKFSLVGASKLEEDLLCCYSPAMKFASEQLPLNDFVFVHTGMLTLPFDCLRAMIHTLKTKGYLNILALDVIDFSYPSVTKHDFNNYVMRADLLMQLPIGNKIYPLVRLTSSPELIFELMNLLFVKAKHCPNVGTLIETSLTSMDGPEAWQLTDSACDAINLFEENPDLKNKLIDLKYEDYLLIKSNAKQYILFNKGMPLVFIDVCTYDLSQDMYKPLADILKLTDMFTLCKFSFVYNKFNDHRSDQRQILIDVIFRELLKEYPRIHRLCTLATGDWINAGESIIASYNTPIPINTRNSFQITWIHGNTYDYPENYETRIKHFIKEPYNSNWESQCTLPSLPELTPSQLL